MGKRQSERLLPTKTMMLDLTKNWKRVIDSLAKGIFVIDAAGSICYANPALEQMTGFRADALIGNTCAMLACSGCEPWYGEEGFWCMLFSSGLPMKPMFCEVNSKSGHRMKVMKQASLIRNAEGIIIAAVETIWDSELFHRNKVCLFPPMHIFQATD